MRRLGIFILFVLVLAVTASAIGVIYARQESRRLFVELTALTKEQDDLRYDFGRLEIERATKAETNQIDKAAREQLGMLAPTVANTVVVKR